MRKNRPQAVVTVTTFSVFLRIWALGLAFSQITPFRNCIMEQPVEWCRQGAVDILTNFDLSVDGLLLQGWNYEYGDFAGFEELNAYACSSCNAFA
nr:hypothetical protein Iba_chr08aCG9540 [Ipomoea batatas]